MKEGRVVDSLSRKCGGLIVITTITHQELHHYSLSETHEMPTNPTDLRIFLISTALVMPKATTSRSLFTTRGFSLCFPGDDDDVDDDDASDDDDAVMPIASSMSSL